MLPQSIATCSKAVVSISALHMKLQDCRRWFRNAQGSLVWFLAMASAASIILRLFDALILSLVEREDESGLTEFCAYGAFVVGALVITQRQSRRPSTKTKLQPPRAPFEGSSAASPKDRPTPEPRRPRKAGGASPAARRLPQLDNLAPFPAAETEQQRFGHLEEAEVAALVDACRSNDLAGARELIDAILARGPCREAAAPAPGPGAVEAPRALQLAVEAWCLDGGGDAERAASWVLKALDAGMPATPRTVQVLMETFITRPMGGRRSAEELLANALAKGAVLDANCFHCLFDRCLPAADAAAVEEWLAKLAPGHDTLAAYIGLIRAQNQTCSPEQAEAWLRRAEEIGVTNLTPVHNAVMQVCVKANNLIRAGQLLELMEQAESSGTRPDIISYSVVMEANAQKGCEQEVERLARRLLLGGVGTEAECYAAIIRVHARSGNLHAATRLLEEARGRGVEVDIAAYNAMITAMAKAGKPERAERLLQQMMQEGVEPDVVAYGAVISGYAKSADADGRGPERLINLMCDRGVEPSVAALGAALHACARIGDKHRAEAIFKRVLVRGKVSPDSVCYNALINASVKSRDIAGAERWLEAMLAQRVSPNVVTYTTLLHAYARNGDIEAAERGLEMMRANRITPNVVSYSALMQACVKAGDIERAEKWFRQMRAAGVQANAVCYSSVLDACAKAGDWVRAERWLAAMDEDGVPPTVVCFNNVINACSKGNDAVRADAWLRRLLRDDTPTSIVIPNIRVPTEVVATRQSFTTAAQAYASFGSFSDVERIFGDMKRFGMGLDQFSLTVLLSAYARSRPRQCERAEKAFREYVAGGGKITPPSFHVLRTCLGSRHYDRLLSQLGLTRPLEN